VELSFDNPYRLVSLFSVRFTKRWKNAVIRIAEHPFAERQPQSVLKAVGLIFGRVELELHAVLCVIHI